MKCRDCKLVDILCFEPSCKGCSIREKAETERLAKIGEHTEEYWKSLRSLADK